MCTHANTAPSIVGLVCHDCRAHLPADAATLALAEHLRALATRLGRAEAGLARAGLVACEACSEWLDAKDRATFQARHPGGRDLVLCASCVAGALDDEEDTRLTDPETGAVALPLRPRLVRWAMRLDVAHPTRKRILTLLRSTYHRLAGV